MSTVVANLDPTQYVLVSSGMTSLVLQSHRDTVRVVFSDTKPAKGNTAFHELGGAGKESMLPIPFTERSVWALAMTDRSSLTITEQRVPIEISNRGGIGQAVYIQDQTTQAIDIWFTKKKGDVTTATVATQGEHSVDLEPGQGALVSVGDVIESRTADNYVQAEIIGVVGDTITVATPWSRTFPIGVTVSLGDPLLSNASGSLAAPVIYSIDPSSVQEIDITRLIMNFVDASTMDFTTFGSIAGPLPNGCTLRYKQSDGTFINLFNIRDNNDLIERSFDHVFQSKVGGAGPFGFVARSTWAGQDKRGVTIRLDGSLGEELQIVVQDVLTSQDKIRVVGQGHVVQ